MPPQVYGVVGERRSRRLLVARVVLPMAAVIAMGTAWAAMGGDLAE